MLALIVLFTILYFTMYNLDDYTNHGVKIAVPVLVGTQINNVEDSLVPYKGVLNYYDKLKNAEVFKSNQKKLMLNIDNKYGHTQSSDRYESMKDMAKIYCIILHFIR